MAEKYAKLGHRPSELTAKPRHLYGLIAGKPGSGKTSLLATCDSCLIINTDLSSVPVSEEEYKATFWPVLGGEGKGLDAQGNPVKLTWDAILTKREQFFRMQDAGEPVPDLVAVDSIAGAIQLIKAHVVKKMGKGSWREVHGPMGWDMLNDEIVEFATSFRQRGIGFYYTCHLVDSKIPIGDDVFKVMPEVTITPSTWKRIVWQLELVAVVDNQWSTKVHEEEYETQVRGKTVTRTRTKEERVREVLITTNREELAGITKGRVVLDDVPLPRHNTWNAFEEAYLKAAEIEIPW
jgi:hypothetical protein